MNLGQINDLVHDRVLNMRRIERYVESTSFSINWDHLTPEEQDECVELILESDSGAFRKWFMSHIRKELGEMTTRELKNVARTKGIKNYSRLPRVDLIRMMEQDEENRND